MELEVRTEVLNGTMLSTDRIKCAEIFLDDQKISIECLICNKVLFQDSNFIQHLQEHFDIPHTVSVNHDNTLFNDFGLKEASNSTLKEITTCNYDCPIENCIHCTESKLDMLAHICEKHEIIKWADSQFGCSFCSSKFSTLDCIIAHLRTKHNFITKLQFNHADCDTIQNNNTSCNDFDLEKVPSPITNENISCNHKCLVKECAYSTETRKEIIIHIFEKHELIERFNSLFRCYICKIKFANLSTVTAHIKLGHNFTTRLETNLPDGAKYECPECKKQFFRLSIFNFHLKSWHKRKFVEIMTKQQEKYEISLTTSLNNWSKLIQPSENIANKTKVIFLDAPKDPDYTNYEFLNDHSYTYSSEVSSENSSYDNNLAIKCPFINCEYTSTESTKKEVYMHILETHELIYEVNRVYFCAICNTSFILKLKASRHLTEKHGIINIINFEDNGNGKFPCRQCTSSLSTSKQLFHHYKRRHLKYLNELLVEEILKLNSEDLRYGVCRGTKIKLPEYNSDVKYAFRLHIDEVNKLSERLEDGSWKCLHCNAVTPTKDKVTKHIRNHFDRKVCATCDKAVRNLPLHVQRHHTKEKRYMCQECGKRFLTKYYLDMHIITHDKDKKEIFKCRFCDKKFRNYTAQWHHQRLVHYKMGPQLKKKCDVCGRVCATKKTLKVHMKSMHSEVKPFKCVVCDKTFKLKSNLELHRKVHQKIHEDTDRIPCDLCDRKYVRKWALKIHKRKHHPNADNTTNIENEAIDLL